MQAPALSPCPGSPCRPGLTRLTSRQRPRPLVTGWPPAATLTRSCDASSHGPAAAAPAAAAPRSFPPQPPPQHRVCASGHYHLSIIGSCAGGRPGRLPPAHAFRPSSFSRQPPGPQWDPNPMELVRREAGLQSNRLDGRLREQVEEAVERLGCRVTVGDVAARAGVKLADADEALKALAYDTEASLKVSSVGEVVYGFTPDFRARLQNRSLLIAAAPVLRRLSGALSYLARVAFGTTLIASVVLVWLAIALLVSSRSDERDRRQHGGGGVAVFMDPSDLFLYWDPYYYRKRAQRAEAEADDGEGGMNFVEAVFSFVFGDGNPNQAFDERRWRALGAMIREKGGVVTAEEMAPFLEPPPPAPVPARGSGEPYVPYPDESFVLPALIKFGGEPQVDDGGRILYRFPALQLTGVKRQPRQRPFQRGRGGSGPEPGSWEVPLERTWELTAASAGQVAGVVTLGVLNLAGVWLLGGLLADPRGAAVLAYQGLGFVAGLLGPLQLYAGAFFAVPALRWLLNQARNRDIDLRNQSREAAVEVLTAASAAPAASPLRALVDKVSSARTLAEAEAEAGIPEAGADMSSAPGGHQQRPRGPRLVRDEDIVFDSGREVAGREDAVAVDEWERKLKQREREWGR